MNRTGGPWPGRTPPYQNTVYCERPSATARLRGFYSGGAADNARNHTLISPGPRLPQSG